MAELIQNATRLEIRAAISNPRLQIGLFGPPGVGKTYDLFEMGNVPIPVFTPAKHDVLGKHTRSRYVGKIQFHSEMSPAEAMGMHVPDGDTFKWEPGPADLAYARGGLLILDELDQASGPMKTYLYGLLDRGPGGTISYVGRTFVQQPGYQVVATMNDWPDQGALPEALLNRFDAWFMVTQPSDEQLLTLEPDLRKTCRDAYDTAVDPMRGPDVTYRQLMGIQELRRIMPLEKAVLGACYNNTVLAGSLLEVIAMYADEKEIPGVTATHAPVGVGFSPDPGSTHGTDDGDDGDDEDPWASAIPCELCGDTFLPASAGQVLCFGCDGSATPIRLRPADQALQQTVASLASVLIEDNGD